MSDRPVFHQDLGGFFKDLRQSRGLKSHRQAERVARERGLNRIKYGALQRLEAGKAKNIDPEFLKELATLYGKPYKVLAAAWAGRRFGLPADTPSNESVEVVPIGAEAFGVRFRAVRQMAGRIAAGEPLVIEDSEFSSAVAFRESFFKGLSSDYLVCVRVGPKEESMIGANIMPGDVVVLETDPKKLERIDRESIYAVRFGGGSTLKRVEVIDVQKKKVLLLVSENKRYRPVPVEIEEGERIQDYIIGRVVWHGQYV